MRFSTVFAIVATTACAYVNAAPVVQSRQGNGDFGCPTTDDNNTQLEVARNAEAGDSNDGGLVCRYTGSGTCRFFADGTFSSGGSGCPQGLVAGGTKSLADGGAAAGGGGAAAAPSTTPAAPPTVAAPTTSASVAPPSSSPSSAATVAPTTSARPIATVSSTSSSASSTATNATNAPQGNGASPIAHQRPMVLVTVLGIAAGAFMAL